MDLVSTHLGKFTAVANGELRRGLPGQHTATVLVEGTGSVSCTVVVKAGNNESALAPVATINASGTGSAVATGGWGEDYQFWRADVTSMVGASVRVDAASDVDAGADGSTQSVEARTEVLSGASAGTSSAWLPIAAYPERLAYALDSGSTATTFSIDISGDGVSSLGQAFTGAWASTTAEITPPLMFSSPQARYFRFNVLSGGPLSVSRGY